MQWLTPKTNWLSDDYINKDDFNRIRNNLLYLYEESQKFYEKYVLTKPIENEVAYSTYAYSELWNFIETTLKDIETNTYKLDIGIMKQFLPYDLYIDYKELNRIESATLDYYNMLLGQKNSIRTLSFTLGDKEGIKV